MHTSLPIIAVNGVIDAQVSPLDRGFAYGDGVFETCKLHKAKISLWNLHKDRLINSCEKLSIPVDLDLLECQLENLVVSLSKQSAENAVVKITVTRGEGGRGYRPPINTKPTIVIGIFPAANYPEHYFSTGVDVKLCEHRLSRNSHLAGLKHLNRLEQILARTEWADNSIAEGLVFDTSGNLIEGVFSNLFLIKDNELYTPDLSEAGVAGVMRRFIIESATSQLNLKIKVKHLQRDDLFNSDAVFLCNSLYGIWPVANILGDDPRSFAMHPCISKLQNLINETLFN